jgi:hypothetical protein
MPPYSIRPDSNDLTIKRKEVYNRSSVKSLQDFMKVWRTGVKMAIAIEARPAYEKDCVSAANPLAGAPFFVVDGIGIYGYIAI